MATSYEQLEEAVDDFFSDTSRTKDETREDLEDLMEYIQIKIDSIPEESDEDVELDDDELDELDDQ